MKNTRLLTGIAISMTAVMTHGATVVYQSDFTGANFADAGLTNEGISGSGNWVHNSTTDRAEYDWLIRNSRAALYTTLAFQSTDGFTLDVSFQHDSVNDSRFSIGLVESGFSDSAGGDWMNSAMPDAYGIGISTIGAVATTAGGDVLAINDGSTIKNNFDSITNLSTAQGNITDDTPQTFSMTVTATNWSYSLNGAAATTGVFSTPFDLSKSYRFITYQQATSSFTAGGGENSFFSNITLTAIPEPSSTALLGLGGLALILRRRK